jgi:hypothetical protein
MRLSPRLVISAVLLLAATAAVAQTPAQTPPMMNYTYTFEGSNEQRLVRNAEMRALRSTVGRFYFSDRLIIAPEILEAWLDRERGQFIAGVTVLDREVDQDRYRLRMDVAVFAALLEQEMERYRYFVRPRPSPLSFVFLMETVDASVPQVPVAKPIVIEGLEDAGLEVSEIAVLSPSGRIDVSEGGADPTLNLTLKEALVNSQRGGVELMFAGQCTTTLTENPDLYYDSYHFYDTTLLLRMFRVDTGDLLGEVVVSDSAAHADDVVAREIAIRKCVGRAIDQLMRTYRAQWPHEIQNRADYQLMVTDIGPEDLSLLEGKLSDLDEDAQVFRRSHFGDVAVLNLLFSSEFADAPIVERKGLLEFLRDLDTPQLRVESVDGSRIVARVVR